MIRRAPLRICRENQVGTIDTQLGFGVCCVPSVKVGKRPVKDDPEAASSRGDQRDVNHPPEQPPEEAGCLEMSKFSNSYLPSQRKHVSLVFVDEWLGILSRENSRERPPAPLPLLDGRLRRRRDLLASLRIGDECEIPYGEDFRMTDDSEEFVYPNASPLFFHVQGVDQS